MIEKAAWHRKGCLNELSPKTVWPLTAMQVISRQKPQNQLLILMCSVKRWNKWHIGWGKEGHSSQFSTVLQFLRVLSCSALLRHYYKCHITLYTCSIPKRSLYTNHVIFQKLKASTVEAWPLKMCVLYIKAWKELFGNFTLTLNCCSS